MTLPAFVASESVAFVTGSTSGIGLEISRVFLAQGCRVIGLARRPAAISHDLYQHVSLDLTTASVVDLRAALSSVPQASQLILVNNAGWVEPLLGIVEMDWEAWRAHQILNVEVPLKLAQALLLREARSHKLAHISSGAAYKPSSAWSAYCSGKAALNMAMRVLAEELSLDVPASILEYSPGATASPMQETLRQATSPYFRTKTRFETLHATHRLHDSVAVSHLLVKEICENTAPGYRVVSYQPPTNP